MRLHLGSNEISFISIVSFVLFFCQRIRKTLILSPVSNEPGRTAECCGSPVITQEDLNTAEF